MITDSDTEYMSEIPSGYSFSRTDLELAFAKVQNPVDWRLPILADILAKDLELVRQSIQYFTATDVTVLHCDKPNMVRVVSVGYRNGPAGP
jgi:hypothetical protein